MAVKKGKKKVQMGSAMGVASNMLHQVVAQNKYDIAPYVKHGKSRNTKGRSK